MKKLIAKQTSLVADWNSNNSVGTLVNVLRDNGSTIQTKTTSEAWLLGGHSAVIKLEGFSGGFSLDRVTVTPPSV